MENKEFNLSEMIWNDGCNDLLNVVHVKEFIRLLKEEIDNTFRSKLSVMEFERIIDKLSGFKDGK